MQTSNLVILSAILVAGFACQWLAWRVKLPSILLLLVTGLVAGPALGWLDPDVVLGNLLEPVVSLAVAVILYEGSVTLRFSEIRGHGAVVRNLVTIGVLITWLTASVSATLFLGWDPYLASLFGAIVTVSGPTVIVPLLRTIRPSEALSGILRWEGILVDPLGAILAVLVFNVIVVVNTLTSSIQVYTTLALIVAVGSIVGVIFGQLLGVVLRRYWLPDFLRNYAALAFVILAFSLAEIIEHESGLLAVTVMGVWQANMRDLDLEDILDFKESLTLVLVAGLFIILAARLDLRELLELGAGALGVLLTLQFIGGPLRALICAAGSELNWRERLYLGWLFPRGIVAAAVSALFALRLEAIGFAGADKLVAMVFAIIVGTVVIQSLTGKLFARWLKVSNPEPNGVLVVGANPVALTFASALQKSGRRVLVASMGWDGISTARMAGLPVYYGSPVSEYAERHLDLIGLGHLLALSHRPGLNELACVRYRYEFGRESVFTIKQLTEAENEKHQVSGETIGRVLYEGKMSMNELQTIIDSGTVTRETEITENFSLEDYRARYPDAVILFATDRKGRLHFPVGGATGIAAGMKIMALVKGDE